MGESEERREMVVILSVLKFLLLFVALLFLLFVLLLLFFLLYPVSYSFQGDKEKEEKDPNASFHLRFPGVHLLISYQNRKIRYSGKILFFTVCKGGGE